MADDTMIAEEFDKFCMAVFGDLGAQQYIDLRRTFFGGAAALYFLVMTKLSPGERPTDGDLELIRRIYREIHRFNEDVKNGHKLARI